MKVRVLRRHIKLGKPNSSLRCPIALAIKETLHQKVIVDLATITVIKTRNKTGDTTLHFYPLPKEASQFVEHFDYKATRHLCKPFTFETKPKR